MRLALLTRSLGFSSSLALLLALACGSTAVAQTRSYRPVSPAESRQEYAEDEPAPARPVVQKTSTRTYKAPQYTAPSQVSAGRKVPLEQVRQEQRAARTAVPTSARSAARPAPSQDRQLSPAEQVRAAERRIAAERPAGGAHRDENVRAANYRRGHDDGVYRDSGVRRAAHMHYDEGPVMEPVEEVYPYQEGFENGGPGDFQGMRGPADGWHRYPDGPCEPYGTCGGGSCAGCGSCNTCAPCGSCGTCCHWGLFDDFSIFAGSHAFKSPLDFGNGNFGLQEGFNWGGSVWQEFGLGYQFGFQAVQSNFSGDDLSSSRGNDRDQYFATFGLFRRVRDCRPHHLGFQWGVVADWRHDEYYSTEDLFQLRGELSVFCTPCDEFGVLIAANSDREEVFIATPGGPGQNSIWDVTDQYRFFYRRQFDCRGEGRIWGGFTENSDGIVGADFRVALAPKWAIDGGWNYIIPKQGSATGGNQQESWNLGMNVVWYPAKTAIRSSTSKWRPLFPVADNGSFVVEFK